MRKGTGTEQGSNRVLITASTLPRWQEDSVPEFILEQALSLCTLYPELEIHILAPHHKGAARYEITQNIHIHRFQYIWPEACQKLVYPAILPNIRKHKWLVVQVPFLLLFEFIAIFKLCIQLKPRLLYSHWFLPQAVPGWLVSLFLNIPHVFTSHSSDVAIMHKVPLLGPWLVRNCIRQTCACTVVSKRTYDKLKSFFSDVEWSQITEKVLILPMGADIAKFEHSRADQTQAIKKRLDLVDKHLILFMGRFSEKKGISFLLRAFIEVLDKQPDTILILAGDGELADEIRQDIERYGLNDFVQMPGYVSGKNKADYLAIADTLVIPSIVTDDGDAEGLPVVLLEGLAAGKICVATRESGADDILRDGENGFIINEKDVDALKITLLRVSQLSSKKADDIRQRALHLASSFDWSKLSKLHYEHLIAPFVENKKGN